MCGRFSQLFSWEQLRDAAEGGFDIPDFDTDRNPLRPRANVAPTQNAVVLRAADHAGRVPAARWGFAHPRRTGVIINARAETAAQLPTFRDAAAHRRCLIPVTAFYEWDRSAPGGPQPWSFQTDAPVIFLAGLWQDAPDAQVGPEFVVLTLDTPAAFTTAVHHRAPGVVRLADASAWLNAGAHNGVEALRLLHAFGGDASDAVRAWPVSKRINSARADNGRPPERAEPEAGLFG